MRCGNCRSRNVTAGLDSVQCLDCGHRTGPTGEDAAPREPHFNDSPIAQRKKMGGQPGAVEVTSEPPEFEVPGAQQGGDTVTSTESEPEPKRRKARKQA